jgi:prefoldin subunit 5
VVSVKKLRTLGGLPTAVILVFLVAATALAQQVSLNKTEFSPGETVVVYGRAVAGAEITVQVWKGDRLIDIRKTTAGADGSFTVSIPLPPTIPYGLWTEYGTYTVRVYVGGNLVAELSFELRPLGGITGIVVDENGNPLANAEVTVVEAGVTVYTDASGRFTVSVEPGEYTVVVSKPNYRSAKLTATVELREVVDLGTIVLTSFDYLIARLETQLSSLAEDVSRLEATVTELSAAVEQLRASFEEAVAGLTDRVAGLEDTIGQLEAALRELQSALETVSAQVAGLADRISAIEEALGGKADVATVERLSGSVAELERRLSDLVSRVEDLAASLSDLRDAVSTLEGRVGTLEAATRAIEELRASINGLRASVEQLRALSEQVNAIANQVAGASTLAMAGVAIAVIGIIIAIVATILVWRKIAG